MNRAGPVAFVVHLFDSIERLETYVTNDELYALRDIARERRLIYRPTNAEYNADLFFERIEYDEEILTDVRDLRATIADLDALTRDIW